MKRETILRRRMRKPTVIDVHSHVGADAANFARGDFPYAQTAEDLLVRLDRWGVGAAVCFPFLYTRYYDWTAFMNGRMRKARDRACPVPYATENRRLCQEIYEAYPACAGRLLPFAFFDPSRDQAGQVSVLRELADAYPVFGLKTATSYIQAPIGDLLKRGQCFVDFAAEKQLPLMIHTSVMPHDPWANVFEVLKVVEARPDVRFCLAHSCRFDRRALDRAAELSNCFVDSSALSIHCQLVQQQSPAVAAKPDRFVAPYRRPADVLRRLAAAYPDTLMYGSDSPYYSFMSRFTNSEGKTTIIKLTCDTDAEIKGYRTLCPAVRARIGIQNPLRYLFGKSPLSMT